MSEESASIRSCYGGIGDRSECRQCGIRSFCRDFAANERALSVGKSRVVGIPEWIPAADPDDRPDPVPEYTGNDMLRLIRFFLTLSEEEIRILQMRIGQPEITNEEIAEKLRIDRKRIYAFFRRETMRLPEMATLLYRHKRKKESK